MTRPLVRVSHIPKAERKVRWRMSMLGQVGFGASVDDARSDLLTKCSFYLRRLTEDAARAAIPSEEVSA